MSSQPSSVTAGDSMALKAAVCHGNAEPPRSESELSLGAAALCAKQIALGDPFSSCQRRSDDDVGAQGLSHEAENPVAARKKTPARAMFYDLTTAHSLITSGSARSSTLRKHNNDASQGQDEKDSIALQELAPLDHHSDSSCLSPPSPSPAAGISDSRLHSPLNCNQDPYLDPKGSVASANPSSTRASVTALSDCSFVVRPLSYDKKENNKVFENKSRRGSLHAEQFQTEPAIISDAARDAQAGLTSRFSFSTDSDDSTCASDVDDALDTSLPQGSQENPMVINGSDPNHRTDTELVRSQSSNNKDFGVMQLSTVGYLHNEPTRSGDDSEINKAYASGMPDVGPIPIEPHDHCQDGNRNPPSSELPPQPDSSLVIGYRTLDSPQGLPNSSSYGDTRNLLQLTESSKSIQDSLLHTSVGGHGGFDGDAALLVASESAQAKPDELKLSNPFRASLHMAVSQNDSDTFDLQERHRIIDEQGSSLERDISMALRRASGYSGYGNGSIFTATADEDEDNSPEDEDDSPDVSVYQPTGFVMRRARGESAPRFDSTGLLQVQSFYDKNAISSKWVACQKPNVIRVPILRYRSFRTGGSGSPEPLGHSNSREGPYAIEAPSEHIDRSTTENDQNEWETVGDSAATVGESALGRPYEFGFIGGSVRRTGSSIANTSDEGAGSFRDEEAGPYSSTDRIVQHSGDVEYFGDYRENDLNDIRTPVFPGVSREHKVNGYLAKPTRTRPTPDQLPMSPPPLDRSHTNPFVRPPNVTLRVKHRRYQYDDYPRPSGQRFHQYQERDITDQRAQRMGEEFFSSQSLSQESEWTEDNIGEPGPMIIHQPAQHSEASITDDGEPFQVITRQPFRYFGGGLMDDGEPGPMITHRSAQYSGASMEGNQSISRNVTSNGSNSVQFLERDHSAALSMDHDSKISEWHKRNENDGFAEVQTYGGKGNPDQARSSEPFAKNPPGAFYRGLRSVSGQNQTSKGYRRPRRARGGGKPLPTNRLRPLSLGTTQQEAPNPDSYLKNSFQYRSPLAPPKTRSWMQLYTHSEMKRIRASAKADGVYNSREFVLTESSSRGFAGSYKRLEEAPRLVVSAGHASTQVELVQQKKSISRIVLTLCTLFPPMLILYATGALDGIISWRTKGRFTGFGLKYKRLASLLMGIWVVVFVVVLVIFLVVWFTQLHPPGT